MQCCFAESMTNFIVLVRPAMELLVFTALFTVVTFRATPKVCPCGTCWGSGLVLRRQDPG